MQIKIHLVWIKSPCADMLNIIGIMQVFFKKPLTLKKPCKTEFVSVKHVRDLMNVQIPKYSYVLPLVSGKFKTVFIHVLILTYAFWWGQESLLLTSVVGRWTVDACDIGLSQRVRDLRREDDRVPALEICERDSSSCPDSSSSSEFSGNDGSFLCLVHGTQKSHQSDTWLQWTLNNITSTYLECESKKEEGIGEWRIHNGHFCKGKYWLLLSSHSH
jgi:hypothetical protein